MSRSSDTPGVRLDPGLVLYVGFDAEAPGELAWPALAALEAADAVLYDGGAEPPTLELIPRRCFVEAVSPAAGEEAAAARANKLAGEGWRVVRLVAGDPATRRRRRPAKSRASLPSASASGPSPAPASHRSRSRCRRPSRPPSTGSPGKPL